MKEHHKTAAGYIQLYGSLNRIVIEKRRNCCATFCEFTSHFIIVIILVLGYYRSKVFNYEKGTYSTLSVQIPPAVISNPSVESAYGLYNEYMNGPLIIPTIDQYITLGQYLAPYRKIYNSAISQTTFGRSFTNLFVQGDLHFAPSSQATANLINYLNTTYTKFKTLKVYIHPSEQDGVSYIMDHLESSAFALIVLRQISLTKVNYVIRQNYTTLPNTNSVMISPAKGLQTAYQQYFLSGYFTLQQAIDQWAFQYTNVTNSLVSKCASGPPNTVLIPYPTYAYNQNPFYSSVGFLLGLALVMSTMYPMSKLTKSIVEEKETKMRELMKIMGLKDWVYACSWFISALILFFFVALTMTLLTTATFIKSSNKFIIFIYFFVFCLSEVTFSFFVSVFFSNSKLAAIAAPVVLFCTILPRYLFYTTNENENVTYKVLASFLSPTAFTFAADNIATFEYGGVGVQFSNIFEGKFNFAICIAMMIVDFVLYGILAWYLDNVLPHEYGTSHHPLFIFDPKYWCGDDIWKSWSNQDNNDLGGENDRGKIDVNFEDMPEFHDGVPADQQEGQDGVVITSQPQAEQTQQQQQWSQDIERIPSNVRNLATIRIKDLGKTYADGKIALQHLSLSMLEGQITCLLGHNGAGKTTAISTLTGLIEATAGDVSIYGHSLRKELASVRRITGLCPQQNVLFPALTVQEHLQFFGYVKGISGKALQLAITTVIEEVGLTEKKNVPSHALSGGMKRKLCLAMALIGDPKFVLLDEPTSGMDPYSRRSTWELLQRNKVGRVILLTTHFMDEADTLADRISIISEGTLLCSGSSLFLKNRFGLGYVLSLSRVYPSHLLLSHNRGEGEEKGIEEEGNKSPLITTQPDENTKEIKVNEEESVEKINLAVHGVIETANLKSVIAGEIIFQLPLTTASLFPALFQMLQTQSHELGIGSYGISITTLEQVFISLAHKKNVLYNDENIKQSFLHKVWIWLQYPLGNFTFSPVPNKETAGENLQPLDIETAAAAVVASAPNHEIEMQPTNYQPIQTTEHTSEGNQKTMNINQSIPSKFNCCKVFPEQSNHHKVSTTAEVMIAGDDGLAKGHIFLQFSELYRKRLIIASRDLKGFFFQIIFPAIQILLILLILTVEVNPAGHTLILNGALFNKYANFVARTLISDYNTNVYEVGLSGGFTVDLTSSPNSTDLSNYLMQLSSYQEYRMGAYIFQDSIPLNLTVNWNWIRTELQNTNVSAATVSSLVSLFNLNNRTFTFQNVQSSSSLSSGNLFGNQYNLSAIEHQLKTTSIPRITNNNYNKIFKQYFNITIPFNISITTPFNISLQSILSNNIYTNISNQVDASVTIHKKGVSVKLMTSIDNNGNTLFTTQLTNVYIAYNQINYSQIVNYLPTGIIQYDQFTVSSPYTVMHNSSSPHAAASWRGELIEAAYKVCASNMPPNNAILQQSLATTKTLTLDDIAYLAKNHPLPITPQQTIQIRIILSLLTSIFVLVPLCYIPASFVAFLVKERVSKSKHLQIVSGVSPYLYWIATYLWDVTLFAILTLFIIMVLFIFGQNSAGIFIGNSTTTLATICLLLVYGASAIPLSYLYSFWFVNFSTAQIAIMVINFMTGFVMVLAYYIMISIPDTVDAAKILVNIFRFFPPYNIGEGLINLSTVYYQNTIQHNHINVFSWNVTGRNLVFMFAEAIGYLLLTLLSESSFGRWLETRLITLLQQNDKLQPPPRKTITDPDVQCEETIAKRLIVENVRDVVMTGSNNNEVEGNANSNGWLNCFHANANAAKKLTAFTHQTNIALLIDSLIKTYPSLEYRGNPKYAVRGISLVCREGERFGLLGINGAGKTTTLGILTGEIHSTSGEVFIGGKSLADPTTQQMIGYCPQVDPLLELMNGYETLWFFGRIRGIPPAILMERMIQLIQQTGLLPYAHKPCGTYSGGNKRKLSLAVALIGDPKVLLLDEPSTGMDPEARRHMWEVIQLVSANRTVILVSHSMEEIEALCTRVGVMVSGRLQCLGSPQHLKSRFGGGYLVEVRCHADKVQLCVALCKQVLVAPIVSPTTVTTTTGAVVLGTDDRVQIDVPNSNGYMDADTTKDVVLEELHGGYFRMRVGQDINLANAFDALEKYKGEYEIYDYNISQCSLEQVFIRFAREQEEEPAKKEEEENVVGEVHNGQAREGNYAQLGTTAQL